MAIFYNTDSLPKFKNAVITIGTFDGVHLGHRKILQEVADHARKVDGESIVVTFEPHPRKLLFPDQKLSLITSLEQKLALISETGIQHIVVAPFTREFSNLSAQAYIEQFLVKLFHPARIIIGYDHHFGHDRTGDMELLKRYEQDFGYKVYEIPAQLIEEATVSSTKIRKGLAAGHVAEAAHMLGRQYSIAGTVVEGAKLGRTIGYPTANIKPLDADQLVPANGVYAVRIKRQEQEYKGMLNIGVKPTVTTENKPTIEVNIFDMDEDLYGEQLEVFFVERLRAEEKFPSLDILKEQLARDRQQALAILKA
jgi:riboflavin kinase / FMN adenylyltransferase